MELNNQTLLNELYGEHPQHYIAVDCVIFGYRDGELKLLLYPRSFEPAKGNWSLLGGFIQKDESSDQAAERILKRTTGLDQIYMEQVAAFTQPDREPSARVISIAYYALIRLDDHDEEIVHQYGADWFSFDQKPELIFDHEEIVSKALAKLQQKATYQLVGPELLPDMFTLTQLRGLYEAIFQRTLDPGNFRKKVLSLGVLKRLNKKDSTESKKGAFYYSYEESPDKGEKELNRIIKL
ncbi:NUDIX hydrolase [Mangrovibacterium diazotrophicum]|uniref:ADP-ribose pyrophosphatase YjhB (NUDIX family) n=1 Tax=Mangrovibacterium diazotrophicum TaxID=1261403 RepID=A0A419VZA9_9BACT|nr:NUDIX domain-containing protein [Mangrovibacterium diazotrophicum]RKD88494.1 ADP-ribose pyrophosphatase YjhB (NUDIX family) [Mangrovibacterium diazotrophicum]